MLNKKMLLSVLIIGCIATVTSAGTWAYFSDAETADANSVEAGKLYLNADSITSASFSTEAMAQPGDANVELGTVNVQNNGNLNGVAYATLTQTSTNNELDDYVKVYITDKAGTQQVLFDGTSKGKVLLGDFAAGEYKELTVSYDFPDNGNPQNEAQGDIFTFDVVFSLEQDKTI